MCYLIESTLSVMIKPVLACMYLTVFRYTRGAYLGAYPVVTFSLLALQGSSYQITVRTLQVFFVSPPKITRYYFDHP